MSYAVPVPDFRVLMDGKDLTPTIRPRLITLTLRIDRGEKADQLDLTLDDSDGRLALPATGATLHVSVGWKAGFGVQLGLVDKGSFIVDEVVAGGPPDIVQLRARSADLTSDLRVRKERSWHATTLGAVAADVARAHGLTARCAPALADVPVEVLAQSRESDMALLRRLGREHDAVATIKAGRLILSPIGAASTAAGRALPTFEIRRIGGDRHSYSLSKRDEHEGVSVGWHDMGAARKKRVVVGKKDGAKHLSRTYATEADARRAASAEMSRMQRDPKKLTYSFALGRASIYPEQRVRAVGFKAEIDAVPWIVASVEHTVAQSGFTTTIDMESAV